MIITIKPVKREQVWSGFSGIRYKNTKDCLTAFYDRHGSRITGLEPEDEEELGKILKKDLSPNSTFWDDYKVIMTNKPITLDTSKPEDKLKYKLLSVHQRVAKADENNPKADYIIYDETREADLINTAASIKIRAYVLFDELSIDQKRSILRLYPGFGKTDDIAPSIIQARLLEQMEVNPAKFVKLVEDKNRDMKIFLKDLVTLNILTKNKNAYKYGTDFLGHDEESTIDHLNDPNNHSLKAALIKEIKSRVKN